MVTITTQLTALYPDISVSLLTDSITNFPTGLLCTAGASHGVAWNFVFQGGTQTGSAAAGALAQTVVLAGTAITDFSALRVRTA